MTEQTPRITPKQVKEHPLYRDLMSLLCAAEQEIHDLKIDRLKQFDKDEYWIYQGDGTDHLDSLVCPVVMSCDKLRDILSHISKLERMIEDHQYIKHTQPVFNSQDVALWDKFDKIKNKVHTQ